MARPQHRELSPRWNAILRFLEANGGLERGYQAPQQEFGEKVGIPWRTLKEFLARMEEYKVITVTRTTVDGGFGSARAYNIYRLKVTADQWAEMAPAVVAKKNERNARAREARTRIGRMEKERAARAARAKEPRPVGRPASVATVREPDEALVDVLVGELDDGDLDGW